MTTKTYREPNGCTLTVYEAGSVVLRNPSGTMACPGNVSRDFRSGTKARRESICAAARTGLDALNAASTLVWSEG